MGAQKRLKRATESHDERKSFFSRAHICEYIYARQKTQRGTNDKDRIVKVKRGDLSSRGGELANSDTG